MKQRIILDNIPKNVRKPTQAEIAKIAERAEAMRLLGYSLQDLAITIKQRLDDATKPINEFINSEPGKNALDVLSKFTQWFDEKNRENAPHEDALDVLGKTLESVSNDSAMTPEVKKIVDMFISLIDYRLPLFNYELETIFRPVITQSKKAAITEATRKAGSASKKQSGKDSALTFWEEWSRNPNKYKNQAVFCRTIIKQQLCDTENTAKSWVNEFRRTHPSANLEKILPQKK